MPDAASKSAERSLTTLVDRAPQGLINLRGRADEAALIKGIARTIGFSLPLIANQVTSNGARQCLWLGPSEWLLIVPSGEEKALIEHIDKVLGAVLHAATDVTGNRAIIGLEGPGAIAFLEQLCSLDFGREVFPEGGCAQTILARIAVLLVRLKEGAGFDIILQRSHRRYFEAIVERLFKLPAHSAAGLSHSELLGGSR